MMLFLARGRDILILNFWKQPRVERCLPARLWPGFQFATVKMLDFFLFL